MNGKRIRILKYINDHPGETTGLAFIPELQINELEVIQALVMLSYNGYLTQPIERSQITKKGKLYLSAVLK